MLSLSPIAVHSQMKHIDYFASGKGRLIFDLFAKYFSFVAMQTLFSLYEDHICIIGKTLNVRKSSFAKFYLGLILI